MLTKPTVVIGTLIAIAIIFTQAKGIGIVSYAVRILVYKTLNSMC